jgi:hypothetical protein
VNELTFIKVQCCTVDEAKRRVAILGLTSFNARSNTFIRCYSKQCLEDPFFYTSLKHLFLYCNIIPRKLDHFNTIQGSNKYTHSGLIVDVIDKQYIKQEYDRNNSQNEDRKGTFLNNNLYRYRNSK